MTGASPAREALARGDMAAVRRHASAMATTAAHAAEGRFLLGIADAGEGRVSAGLAHVEAAIAIAPTAEYLAHHARLLILMRRDGEARDAARAAEASGPVDALTFDTIGNIHARLGDHQAARRCFQQAVTLEPGNMDFRFNLAVALGFLGDTAAATAQHEIILAQAPASGRTHHALSVLTRARADANHIERLESVLARHPSADDALRIRYALAKEYEDIGNGPAAFRHLEVANAAHKARIRYSFASDAAIFDAIEAGFRRPDFFAGTSTIADAPIFITGMPRTGTTLVDRILSAHPDVHSAGELQAMPLAIKLLAGTGSRRATDPETIAASAALDPGVVGASYLARANQHRRAANGRFIDKLPANFLNIGHIARAMPHASIICLRRHPLDTIWSNYKNLFASTSPYYFYSYDLIDIARYYARFDRLMAFWSQLFPGRILQLSYERLVADQEGESRRLFAHCGLGWTEAALAFHTQTAAVATPSAAQVRRPMNSDAVARWRVHAEALAPARAFLEAQGIAADPDQAKK